jgi:glycosyltransferase involved in cell wall biosynthesis
MINTTLHQVLASPLIGGAGVVAIRLAAAAQAKAISCLAWVPAEGPASRALEAAGVKWRLYDLAGFAGTPAAHVKACFDLWRGLVALERPIVHVHNPVIYRYLWPSLAAARARKVVHFQIEPGTDEIEYALRHPPDHVIACAGYIGERIAAFQKNSRLGRAPVTAIPNAIDTKRFAPGPQQGARRKLNMPTDRFVVLMLANLAPHKGQETVLKAVSLLQNRMPVECWLAGEDRTEGERYEVTLRELSAKLGIEHAVRFLGFRADADDLLRAADVFVLPSTHEGLPLSILEAQAAGVPVIGSTIPGIAEVVIDSQTGFLVEANDTLGYATRIHQLFEQPELRRFIIDAAAAKVSRDYDWRILESRVFDIYKSLS